MERACISADFTRHLKNYSNIIIKSRYIYTLNVKHSKYVPHILNYLMAEVRVYAIHDKRVPTRGGYIALHSDHAVLDVAHGLFQIKKNLFVVVLPSLVHISASQLEGSSVHPQHHQGQRWGGFPGQTLTWAVRRCHTPSSTLQHMCYCFAQVILPESGSRGSHYNLRAWEKR